MKRLKKPSEMAARKVDPNKLSSPRAGSTRDSTKQRLSDYIHETKEIKDILIKAEEKPLLIIIHRVERILTL